MNFNNNSVALSSSPRNYKLHAVFRCQTFEFSILDKIVIGKQSLNDYKAKLKHNIKSMKDCVSPGTTYNTNIFIKNNNARMAKTTFKT